MAQKRPLPLATTQSMSEPRTPGQIVTILGGGGFLGRYVVRALTKRGYRVRIAVRRPGQAIPLQPLGNVGQVVCVQANIRDRESLAQVIRGSHAVINLTGILYERGDQTFEAVHVEGAKTLAEVVPVGMRLIHISAIGADSASPSAYGRSKAAGEAAVLAVHKDAIILRPSVIFGPGDGFFTRLANLSRLSPMMPVLGPNTRLQPVFAADVAEVIARAVDGSVPGGRIYELGGPTIATMRELTATMLKVVERKKKITGLSFGFASFLAYWVDLTDRMTLGLVLPRDLVFTPDQIQLLKSDNVVSAGAVTEGRTLEGLGIEPTSYEGIIPAYLVQFRKAGEFETNRERRKLLDERTGSDK